MKISENQLSWKSDTFCRSENAPVIKNKSGIKYEARKMTTQFTKLQQFLSRGALGPIRNRKTVEKNIQNQKTEKIRPRPKTACKTVKTDTFSHPSY